MAGFWYNILMKINFQNILDQYKGDLKFESLTGELNLLPDEFLYMIETNKGTYFVFEADYLDSFDYVSSILKERTEHYTEFIEAKNLLEEYKETTLKKYVTKGHGSYKYNYTLLIKK